MKFPKWRDPRFMQAAVLIGYAVTAREIFNFERTNLTTLLAVLLAVLLDLSFGFFKFKRLVFPLSAIITALGTSLLIYSPIPTVYLLAVALAVASKALISYKGKHFYNPSNFGVVVMLLLFPSLVTGAPELFSGYITPSIVFFVLGIITVIYSKQAMVSFSWMLGFMVFALIRSVYSQTSFFFELLPMLAPSFLLFTFHMISDPATVPTAGKNRIYFGLILALGDAIFRYFQIPYGMFYSLFIVCSLNPFIKAVREPRESFVKEIKPLTISGSQTPKHNVLSRF